MSGSKVPLQGHISRGDAFFLDPNALVIVGLDVPETDENWYAHCARLADETDADLSGYVADILATGTVDEVVQGCKDGNKAIVLDGRRTTRSARIAWSAQAQAGVKMDERVKVRVVLHQGEPDDWFRINVASHKAKPLSPLQAAKGYLAVFKRFGEDHKRVAELYGCTVQTVKNQLAVFGLSEGGKKAFDAGKLPLREVPGLAALPREEQNTTLEALAEAGASGGTAIRNGVKAAKVAVREGKAIKAEVGNDKSKMRSRVFLERWLPKLRKVDAVHRKEIDPVDLLKFILGGPVPRGVDEQVKESLEAAGFKPAVKK